MSDDPKQQATGLFEREWHSFDPWIRGLTADQLDRPVFGEGVRWRVRDMDEQNALTDEEWRAVPIETRWERWHHAHSAMMEALGALRADQLLDPQGPDGIRRWFAMPGFVHLRLHREHIAAALKETATT